MLGDVRGDIAGERRRLRGGDRTRGGHARDPAPALVPRRPESSRERPTSEGSIGRKFARFSQKARAVFQPAAHGYAFSTACLGLRVIRLERPTSVCQSAFVLLALPAIIHALAAPAVDSVPIRINYDAPASCPNQDAFYDALRARTQRVRKAQGNEPRVDVNVRLTRSERRFHGEMREVVNQDETSSRNVDGETCKEVVEALAFTVALSLDPEAHAPVPPEVEPPPAPKPDTVAVPLTSPSEAAKTSIPGARLELEIGLSVLGTVVETAGFATGAALSVMLLRETSASKSGAVQLSLLFAGTGLLTAPDDHRTRFGALALDACPFRHRSGSFEIAPCALGTLGFMELTGRGVEQPATVDRAWLSVGLDVQMFWLLGRGIVFESAVGASVPLARHRYYTNTPDQVIAATPAISPLIRLGLGYRF